MPRPKTLKEALRKACDEGRNWAEHQPSLRVAWENCEVGAWMAWWLVHFRGVPEAVLQALASYSGITETDYRGTVYWLDRGDTTAEQQRAYAILLRRTFQPNGAYRRR